MDAVIIPSLFFDVDQIEKASIGNKKNIIFSGRDIAVKNVSLHEVVFDILSKRLPEYNFILISDRYEKVTSVRRNLLFYPILHKVEYYKMLECTILNVFISFEMGGISSLEACMYGAPTVSLEKNGIYEYLSPSAEFTVAIDQLDKPYVIAKMIEKIIINKWYTVEIENQKSSLNLYSSDNVLNKLMDIYK